MKMYAFWVAFFSVMLVCAAIAMFSFLMSISPVVGIPFGIIVLAMGVGAVAATLA